MPLQTSLSVEHSSSSQLKHHLKWSGEDFANSHNFPLLCEGGGKEKGVEGNLLELKREQVAKYMENSLKWRAG